MATPNPVRVLVVEDDDDSSDALQLLLEHEGFEVERTGSVRETRDHFDSLQRAHSAPPDVIVLDLGLPDYSPLMLTDEIRRMDPPPEIIVHSAAPREILHAAATCLGAVAQMRKPSNCSDLVALIRAAADRTLPVIR